MSDLTLSTLPIRYNGRNQIPVTLLSGQKVFAGGLAAVKTGGANAGKFVGVGTDISNADGYSRVVGTFASDYDASSSGANADITALVEMPRSFSALYLANDNVTTASIGSKVYVKDNHTATTTVGSNAVAGICWGVETIQGVSMVLVEILPLGIF